MKFVKGNLLDVKEGYIMHQCNCITTNTAGLAKALEKKYKTDLPYHLRKPDEANSTTARLEDRSIPGTVFISGSNPYIINIFGQYGPGKLPKSKNQGDTELDSREKREKYFETALEAIVDFFEGTTDLVQIAIPHKIGCGLAGGDWDVYFGMLYAFETKLFKLGVKNEITIYEL